MRRYIASFSPHIDRLIGSTIFDTLVVPFFYVHNPMRYASFRRMSPCERIMFVDDIEKKDRKSMINPTLVVLMSTDDHAGKTLLSPASRALIKDEEPFP